jgi:hypothetical protein
LSVGYRYEPQLIAIANRHPHSRIVKLKTLIF